MDAVLALIAAAAAAGTFFIPAPKARAVLALLALALVPVMLAVELWDTSALEPLRTRPAPAAFGLALAAMAMGVMAFAFDRRPWLFAPLAVGALPFRIPVDTGGETANLLLPLYFVIGAGVLAYVWSYLSGRRQGPEDGPGATEAALLLALVLYAVQSSYSSDFEVALKNIAFFYVPFALMLRLLTAVRWQRETIVRCAYVLLGLALLFAVIGFFEYATKELLLNPKVIAQNQFQSFFRVNSLFFDPSIYGRFLALVMLGVSAVMLWSSSRRTVILAALALLVLWAALLLTFSQSSFAALLVGCAVLAAARWGLAPVVGAIGAVAVAGLVLVLAAPGAVNLDLGSEGDVDRATSGRGDLLTAGVELWQEKPVQGHGSGAFNERFRDREEATFEQASAASHTIPVTVAVEQGVPGLLAYALLLLTSFSMLFHGLGGMRRPSEPPPLETIARMALAACFAALVFHTWVYAAFLEDPLTWAIIGASIGIAASGASVSPSGTPSPRTHTATSSP